MRKDDCVFDQWVVASAAQRSAYEEAKNKDYTRNFLGNQDALQADFRRQNYFILENVVFQSKREREFTPQELTDLQLKLERILPSEKLSRLIQSIGGQAFQAPLNVLEYLHFQHEQEALSLVAKYDLGFYFYCDDDLHYINVNFSYAIKNPTSDKNYILDGEVRDLVAISDEECQALSTALNAISNDLQRYFGAPIHQMEKECKAETSSEKAARCIVRAFRVADNIHLKSIITSVEREIRPLIREYLLERHSLISANAESKSEYLAITTLLNRTWRPILGGGDHMSLIPHWNHLQVSCPVDASAFAVQKDQWQESHSPGDVLIIRLPENHQWLAYKMDDYKNLELKRLKKDSAITQSLGDVNSKNVRQFDSSIVRDLLPLETRAVRQVELILGRNSEAIEDHFLVEESPMQALINLKKSLDINERERIIHHLFNKASSSIRDQVPERSVRKYLKFLVDHFLNPYVSRDLNEGEFIQWVDSSLSNFFESLKISISNANTRVQQYYQSQSLPKIMAERTRQIGRRRRWVQEILKLDLNNFEIMRFSRELVYQAAQIFNKSSGFYENMAQAFYALYSGSLHGVFESELDRDNFIYRMVYMKSHDAANASFLDILLCEAIHCKIMDEHNWTPSMAEIFRTKSSAYLASAHVIMQEATHKMETQIKVQTEEKERAIRACDQIKQNAIIFLESPQDSKNFAAGMLMVHFAEDLSAVVHTHYKNHHLIKPHEGRLSQHHEDLLAKANEAIDARLAKEETLKKYEGLGEKIKNYVLNILILVFTLGVLPLARKFVLKKPAFFSTVKNEIAQEARLILSRAN
jgi:hypothetical protein